MFWWTEFYSSLFSFAVGKNGLLFYSDLRV